MATEETKKGTLEEAYYKLNVVSRVIGNFADPDFKMTKPEAMGLRVITQEVVSFLDGYLRKEEEKGEM